MFEERRPHDRLTTLRRCGWLSTALPRCEKRMPIKSERCIVHSWTGRLALNWVESSEPRRTGSEGTTPIRATPTVQRASRPVWSTPSWRFHPFADGHGRTGRALIHGTLGRRNEATSFVPPVSRALATNSSGYFDGLASLTDVISEAATAAAGVPGGGPAWPVGRHVRMRAQGIAPRPGTFPRVADGT